MQPGLQLPLPRPLTSSTVPPALMDQDTVSKLLLLNPTNSHGISSMLITVNNYTVQSARVDNKFK